MDHVKNRGRSKFFTCFSPVFADDDPGRDSENSVRWKKRAGRGFAAAMKAVFFKTSLAKKCRNKKSGKDSFRSNSGYSSSSANAKFVNTKKNSEELLLRTNSNASSIFSPSVTDSSRSSSRSSSISSNSRSGSERIKPSASSLDFKKTLNPLAVKRDGEKCGCTVGMCMFIICLVALVFWGKVFAVVTCTSACLFFAPFRRQRRCRLESAASSVDLSLNYVIDSEEDKKRVIMEGLLERNRPRVIQP
ncbi:uncharacterized protein [Primulina eburnea]|uniref:uncharacterized protein n=1 Tax=Primulina eburnea TaxID=1245227 RepID=UPI003C6C0B1A